MMNDRVYLLTGAAGFLGSNVCRQLLDRGNTIRAFVLPGESRAVYTRRDGNC